MLRFACLPLAAAAVLLTTSACSKKQTASEASEAQKKAFQQQQKIKAAQAYRDLIEKYPESRHAAEAKQRLDAMGPVPTPAKAAAKTGGQVTRKERAGALCVAFAATYPDAHCELDFSTPLELLIATILSAQCTDKRVNLVTPHLFRRCPTARDYATINPEELEGIIQSTGFFRAKAKNIRACCTDLVEKHGGEVPREMDALTALAGVGRKTANVVLGNAYDINEGVVVDTHVQRLSARLGLSKETDPVKIEGDLMKLVPREQWTIFSHWLIWHGRRRCFARNPDCPGCEVKELCPSAFKVPGAKKADGEAAKPKRSTRKTNQPQSGSGTL